MRLIYHLYLKIIKSTLISICVSFSIFFIFSLFGSFNENYSFINILFISFLNSLQIFTFVPSFIFIFSIFIFINELKTNNELIIIKEYIRIDFLMLVFSPIFLMFTFFEINKDQANNWIEQIKNNVSINNRFMDLKVIIEKRNEDKIFNIYKKINFTNKKIDEYLSFQVSNNEISRGEFSKDLKMSINSLAMNSSTLYEDGNINNIDSKKIILNDFNDLDKMNTFSQSIYVDKKKLLDFIFINKFFFYFLFYICIFITFFSKKIVDRKSALFKIFILVFSIFLYYLIIPKVSLNIMNFQFQLMSSLIMILIFLNLRKNE